MIDLSIIICSLPHRVDKFSSLLNVLLPQIKDNVELVIISGGTKQSDKLNRALKIIRGKYTVIVDDDDMVANNFVDEILKHVDENNDMIGYDIYYNEFDLKENTDNQKPYRFIHHTFRTSLLKKFPKSNGLWDPAYVYSLKIKKWAWIKQTLYHYLFDPNDTAQNEKS